MFVCNRSIKIAKRHVDFYSKLVAVARDEQIKFQVEGVALPRVFYISLCTHTAKHPNIAAFDVPRYIEIEWFVTCYQAGDSPSADNRDRNPAVF